MRCTAISESTNQQCKAHCLHGEDKCLYHSKSAFAKEYRESIGRPISRRRMVFELQQQLGKIKSADIEALEKSREIRAIITQIDKLKTEAEFPEEKEEEPKKENTFEKRVEKSMESKEK